MRKAELVGQRGKQDTTDPAIEIFEWMNPLEAPIRPCQESCTSAKRSVGLMAQSFGKIITELPHVDRHFIVRRWGVGSDLHIHIAEPASPIGEQMTSETLVPDTQPF